ERSQTMTTHKIFKFKLTNKKILDIILWSIFLMVLAGVISVLGLFGYAAIGMPAFDTEKLYGSNNTILYAENEEVLASLHAGENRTDVKLAKVPAQLVDAFIATEDREFYQHHGINILGIVRAGFINIKSGDLTAQGASTITQQLVRITYLSSDKKVLRKLREIMMAFELERNYSKDEILAMYMNKVYFGAGAYGVQAASNTYFDKDVSQLNLAESALIAGLVQSPNNYNPFLNPDKALERRKIVLESMVSSGYLDEAAAKEASDTPLQLVNTPPANTQYGYFKDAVIEEAIQVLAGIPGYEDSENAVYTAGLKIYTTINPTLQAYAEEYCQNADNFPPGVIDGQKVQVAMALLEHESGAVKAVIGGREYLKARGFNRATNAYRQPGSAIKPITVYTTALEKGISPYTKLNDAPISYQGASGTWTPKNYDGRYRGYISMQTAIKYSINTYAVQLMDKVGVRSGFETGKAMGLSLVDGPGENDLNLASLALGGLTKGVTPLQMAGAYCTFGNTGMYNKPHFIEKIVDSKGVAIYKFPHDPQRVMTEETATLMNNMLRDVVLSGTGTSAKVPGVPTAGKTGTTEDLTDIWFCGVTPLYSCAVWIGYDNQSNKMVNVAGGGYPALMFKAMMQNAHQSDNTNYNQFTADLYNKFNEYTKKQYAQGAG
ncbi:MAG TPA: PBP1A family penicillin-binding protein, partial [Desulfitobacteriaceae bacterium]|nr:PBP1A family penicillin-binding protein [Desulfitobacteriaceae bacterium]